MSEIKAKLRATLVDPPRRALDGRKSFALGAALVAAGQAIASGLLVEPGEGAVLAGMDAERLLQIVGWLVSGAGGAVITLRAAIARFEAILEARNRLLGELIELLAKE